MYRRLLVFLRPHAWRMSATVACNIGAALLDVFSRSGAGPVRDADLDAREQARTVAGAALVLLAMGPGDAALKLDDTMAKTPRAVLGLLEPVWRKALEKASADEVELQRIATDAGSNDKIAGWDWRYYQEKLRAEKFAFDEAELKPYLQLENIIAACFDVATRLFGITFQEVPNVPGWHPDVRTFKVLDADGSELAIFLADYFARPSKRSGAWMNAYVSQNGLTGDKPVVANHLNIPKPPAGEPTLLTWDEVKTAFHEFGHALHGIFSNVKYPRFAGTAVPRDFVEYPSQVNEMWRVWPEILAHYAKHYQTGTPLPQALLDKVLATTKFNQGFATTELVAANVIDQAWHQLKPGEVPGAGSDFSGVLVATGVLKVKPAG